MIEGFVNANLEAVVPLSLRGPEGPEREVDAVIDTGYSGFLTLPPSVVAELELPYVLSSRATLADDTEVGFSVYSVTALWDSSPRRIEADAVGSTPLVGMFLLDRHDLNIEVVDGGHVVIQAQRIAVHLALDHLVLRRDPAPKLRSVGCPIRTSQPSASGRVGDSHETGGWARGAGPGPLDGLKLCHFGRQCS